MIRAHYLVQIGLSFFIRIGLQRGRSDFDIKELFSSAQGCLGDVSLLGNFVFLKLESCNLVNTFRCKFRTGDEKKYQLVQLAALAVAVCFSLMNTMLFLSLFDAHHN